MPVYIYTWIYVFFFFFYNIPNTIYLLKVIFSIISTLTSFFMTIRKHDSVSGSLCLKKEDYVSTPKLPKVFSHSRG